ncbi:MAG TPA: 2-keto-4-pentenoate hydratase [Ruminococcaceae bacterium]|nr:2-keto-4-pentenoate hydratase [Oscillospiraceae bacterium]
MREDSIVSFASLLYDAAATKIAVRPLTELDGNLSIDDAYAIQLKNVERAIKEGKKISGKKIGLTSEGIQKQLGVNEPDYGHLFTDMEYPDGKIPRGGFLQPKIEAEIAFVLKADLTGGNITREDVLDATDYVIGAFEIVDSRVADWKIKLIDTVADNASSGCYILGSEKINPRELCLPDVGMELYKNGELIGQGTGAAVLGDPSIAVAWLANRLLGYGVTLKKGEVILSGAFSAAPAAEKGDVFEARFTGLGEVKAEFI